MNHAMYVNAKFPFEIYSRLANTMLSEITARREEAFCETEKYNESKNCFRP